MMSLHYHMCVEQCDGCSKRERRPNQSEYLTCVVYQFPHLKWKSGWCNHNDISKEDQTEAQRKLNPLKASKRGGKVGRPLMPTRKYTHGRMKNKGVSKKRYITGHLDAVPTKKGQPQK